MGEPFHHFAIIQRLGSYLTHNGRDVFYSPESFLNTEAWAGVPLIYTDVVDGAISHPDFEWVDGNNLPPEYRVVGRVGWAFVPREGQPRLEAELEITDAYVEQIARDGLLGLSTGFSAQTIPDGDTDVITGAITPNHVLLFEQGACPNCFPRDNGAMFLNVKEKDDNMSEDAETKSLLYQIRDKLFGNTAEVEQVAEAAEAEPEVDTSYADLSAENEQLKNTIDALTKELETFKAEAAQREKDAAWNNIKNTLPEGWLGAKEAETREQFENSKDAFYQRLMSHKAEFSNTKAQGKVACGCKANAEEQLKNALEENMKRTGYRPFGGN